MKGIQNVMRTYLNSGCERIIVPCFGYNPDKFLHYICVFAYREGIKIKTHKIVGFHVEKNETEIFYEITIVNRKEKPILKQYKNPYKNPYRKPYTRTAESLEKDKKIFELRKEGLTLQEIGDIVGLTREGVRQRLKKIIEEIN